MITFFKTLYLLGIAFISIVIICETIASRLNDKNKFRKWWRKNVIAEYND